MGVEDSHDDVVIMEVEKRVKVWCEIRGTTGYGGGCRIWWATGYGGGIFLMVAVMYNCSVMSSEGKMESGGMLVKGMEW